MEEELPPSLDAAEETSLVEEPVENIDSEEEPLCEEIDEAEYLDLLHTLSIDIEEAQEDAEVEDLVKLDGIHPDDFEIVNDIDDITKPTNEPNVEETNLEESTSQENSLPIFDDEPLDEDDFDDEFEEEDDDDEDYFNQEIEDIESDQPLDIVEEPNLIQQENRIPFEAEDSYTKEYIEKEYTEEFFDQEDVEEDSLPPFHELDENDEMFTDPYDDTKYEEVDENEELDPQLFENESYDEAFLPEPTIDSKEDSYQATDNPYFKNPKLLSKRKKILTWCFSIFGFVGIGILVLFLLHQFS